MKFIGTKTLETDRLILRRATLADADAAYQSWCTSDVVSKYVMWEKHKSIEETRAIYAKWLEAYQDLDTYRWIAELKDTGEVIGTIDISKKFLPYGTCEVGYCYAEKYWSQGYGTEILTRVIKFLFEECDADIIVGEHMDNNPASGRVMAKSGLKYETKLRERINDKMGRKNDLIVYSLTNKEYFEEKQNG